MAHGFGGGLRAAIYARVSTGDQHTIPEQVRQLEELARRRGWKIVRTVREIASGASKRAKRDERLDDARRRGLDGRHLYSGADSGVSYEDGVSA